MCLGGNGQPSTRAAGTEIRSYMLTAPCERHFLSETWNSGDPGPGPGLKQATGYTVGGPGGRSLE